MANYLRSYTRDALTAFDAVAVTTATTDYGDTIDLRTTALVSFDVVLDITTLDVADGDETYVLALQLGDASDFSGATVERAALRLGDSSQLALNSADSGTGRIVLGADNSIGGTGYRYARFAVTAAGTTPSVSVSGFLSMRGGVAGGA